MRRKKREKRVRGWQRRKLRPENRKNEAAAREEEK
jgi:hypothetical protein